MAGGVGWRSTESSHARLATEASTRSAYSCAGPIGARVPNRHLRPSASRTPRSGRARVSLGARRLVHQRDRGARPGACAWSARAQPRSSWARTLRCTVARAAPEARAAQAIARTAYTRPSPSRAAAPAAVCTPSSSHAHGPGRATVTSSPSRSSSSHSVHTSERAVGRELGEGCAERRRRLGEAPLSRAHQGPHALELGVQADGRRWAR